MEKIRHFEPIFSDKKLPGLIQQCQAWLVKMRPQQLILLSLIVFSNSAAALTQKNPVAISKSAPVVMPACHSFADIVEPLIPAVVNIYTVKYKPVIDLSKKNQFSDILPFDLNELFEQFSLPFNLEDMYSDPKAVSLGSGFIIDPSGFIVTNYHVVNNVDEIKVKFLDNTELTAKLIGSDKRTDLALLKVEAKTSLPFVKFGDSAKARVGDWIIAIGNPFGLGGTVTSGIISSKGRDIMENADGIIDDFIQTDAAINSGNSGGPAFNLSGEVIGINTSIYTPTGVNVGIGFAIPANTAQNIIGQLKKIGKISRGRLGITLQDLTPEIAEGFGLKEPVGALVLDVHPGGSGDQAGIKSGDVITEFAQKPVKNWRKLQILVAETPINTEVKITVNRGGKNYQLVAKITENDQEVTKSAEKFASDHLVLKSHHLTFSNITDGLKQKFTLPASASGVVVISTTPAKSYKLVVGDLIVAVNQQPITNIEQFNAAYMQAKEAKKQHIVLSVKRRSANIFVALPVLPEL